ncbi:MAG TPA: FAD-dependent oxidoreductase, partial [Candidatus Binatia bacterium]
MAELLERLARVAGKDNLITDPARLDEISWDALSEARIHPAHKPPEALPLCIAAPDSTAQVREIVAIANETKTPLIPYGGGSGLMGGALTIKPGIALDLRRMNRVVSIDAEAMSARVEAGAVLEAVNAKLGEQGFILGHDPWTLPVATIGGAISTNSVGYRAGKYGSMGEQVMGLEVVLANG